MYTHYYDIIKRRGIVCIYNIYKTAASVKTIDGPRVVLCTRPPGLLLPKEPAIVIHTAPGLLYLSDWHSYHVFTRYSDAVRDEGVINPLTSSRHTAWETCLLGWMQENSPAPGKDKVPSTSWLPASCRECSGGSGLSRKLPFCFDTLYLYFVILSTEYTVENNNLEDKLPVDIYI